MQEQDQLHLPESLKEALELAKQVPTDGELHRQQARTWEQVVTRRERSRLRGRVVPFAVALVAVAALIGYLPNAGLFGGDGGGSGKNTASSLKPVPSDEETSILYENDAQGYQLVKSGQMVFIQHKDGTSSAPLFTYGEADSLILVGQNPPHFALKVEKSDYGDELYMVDAEKGTVVKQSSKARLLLARSDDRKAQPLYIGLTDPNTFQQRIYAFDWVQGAGKLLYESSHHVFDQLDAVGEGVVLASQYEILLKNGVDGEWKTVASSGDKANISYQYGSQTSLLYIQGSAYQPGPENGYQGTARVMRYDVKSGASSQLLPNREGDQTLLSYSWDDVVTADQKVGYVIGNFVPKQPVAEVGSQARANQPGTLEVWLAVPGEQPKKLFDCDTTWSRQHLQLSHEPDGKHIRFLRTDAMMGEAPVPDWIWDPATGDIRRDNR